MEGKIFVPIALIALTAVPLAASSPALTSPVLPEVKETLAHARDEVASGTFSLARAHAELVLLDRDIPYSVSFENVPSAKRAAYQACLDYAIGEWEKNLDGTVHFNLAPKGQTTNIVVRFKPSVTMKKEQVAGYVNWTRTIKTGSDGTVTPLFTADLQIRVKDLEGKDMPADAMRHAAMHELGHVLGLDDSPKEGDVMGPLDIENPVSTPTELEIQTVRSFRDQAMQILDETKDPKVQS